MGPQNITYLQSYFPAHTNMLGSFLIFPSSPFLSLPPAPHCFFATFSLPSHSHSLIFLLVEVILPTTPPSISPFPFVTYIEKSPFVPLNFFNWFPPPFCLLPLNVLKIKETVVVILYSSRMNLLSSDSLLLCVKLVDFFSIVFSCSINLPDSTSLKFSLPFFCVWYCIILMLLLPALFLCIISIYPKGKVSTSLPSLFFPTYLFLLLKTFFSHSSTFKFSWPFLFPHSFAQQIILECFLYYQVLILGSGVSATNKEIEFWLVELTFCWRR